MSKKSKDDLVKAIHPRYLQTLTAVDITTGSTECLALKHRSQHNVSAPVKLLRDRLQAAYLALNPVYLRDR